MSLRLHTDSPLAFRPIQADDHERLRHHHARLSPESRYQRFHAAKPTLSRSDMRYLVEVDGRDHLALVATLPELPGEPIVAVARCVRVRENHAVAEVAIVVGDDFQRRGVGAELLRRLAALAVERGVTRFRATMFADNTAVQRLFQDLAAGEIDRRRLGGLSEMEFPLPGSEAPGAERGPAAARTAA